MAGARSRGSHRVCTQEAERETNVDLFIHSKATAYGGCGAAYVQGGYSFLGKTSRNFLTGTSNSVPPMWF